MSRYSDLNNLIIKRKQLEEDLEKIKSSTELIVDHFAKKYIGERKNTSYEITSVSFENDFLCVYLNVSYGCCGDEWEVFHIPLKWIERDNLDHFSFYNINAIRDANDGFRKSNMFSRYELHHNDEILEFEKQIKTLNEQRSKKQKIAQLKQLQKELENICICSHKKEDHAPDEKFCAHCKCAKFIKIEDDIKNV